MQLNSTLFFFFLEVEHIISCLDFATFVTQIYFAFGLRFLFFDFHVLTIFPFQILAVWTVQIWDSILEVSVMFALLIFWCLCSPCLYLSLWNLCNLCFLNSCCLSCFDLTHCPWSTHKNAIKTTRISFPCFSS